MRTILFLAFDNKLGLTYHFVDWILALDKKAGDKLKIIFVTLKNEQNPGLHKKLKENQSVDVITINNADEFDKLECIKQADIVHCQGFRQVARALKIKKTNKLKFKIAVSMHAFRHGCWYRPIYTNLISLLYINKIDAINFLSHNSKNEFIRCNPAYKRCNYSFVFPLGCNEDDFAQEEPIEELPFYDQLVKSKKNIVYLAEFSRRKQHLWLLKTIKDILIKEEVKLWLFGGDAGERKKITRYINENGLSLYVKMPGRVDRKFIPSILKRMNLAICTSKSETFGHVIVEPMFAGIPVVTFDTGAASYLIRDFSNGFVIRNKTEKENFRKAVEFLLKNKEAAETMGKNNRKTANQLLTWDITADNTINMYLGII
jgi:glycosyltransferase involved in cell wall biosynthesis